MSEPTLKAARPAKLERSISWLRNNLLNHAEIELREYLAEAPDDRLARRLYGIALFKLGRRAEGVATLAAAAQGDPKNPRAWCDLAVAFREHGQDAAAVSAYGQAIAAQTPGASAPPLSSQTFSTDVARHDFKMVDYEYHAQSRYGGARPPHPELQTLIAAGRDRYAGFLDVLGETQADFAQLPLGGNYETSDPFLLNSWFPPLDAMALTGMLRAHNPARFVEIGSGVSTKYARRAVKLYGLRTWMTSIDPQPRNVIDSLCDEVIRRPLEDCDLTVFESLGPGDIFFLDSSHRSFQGSDVTVFFLEILPRLKPGVIVHIHDIYLPDDYLSGHVARLWNEQYLLAAALLFGSDRFEILFPAWFVGQDPELRTYANSRLCLGPLRDLDLYGASFWLKVAPTRD